MRIISGNLKGSTLHMLSDKNTRPLKDMVRESIFNLLTHSKKISVELENSNILDLYSGTGSFGLECLSRKAKFVYFIENKETALKTLEKNIEKFKLKKKTKIFFNDVFEVITQLNVTRSKFNIIFCDPPFKNKNIKKLLQLLFNQNVLNKAGVIILHRNKTDKENFPDFYNILDERVYGNSKIIFGNF